jgi:two-component system phosphate regulon response regulator PhoB/two-component system alkaline phosphatase synthesis response regulator PhoP
MTDNSINKPDISKNPLVAVVDDENDILELISINLEKSGFRKKTFQAARPFFEFLKTSTPELVVLDLMLPDIHGLEVCKTLKQHSKWRQIPILMLTALGDETDVILGLELGADDYMVKPFSVKELIARIKAILRRNKSIQDLDSKKMIVNDILTIDVDRHEVFVREKKVTLTKTEFTILTALANKLGWVYSREKLMSILWGDEKFIIDRTIDVHIKNLRDKLGEVGHWIKSIRGVGYKLEP